LRSLPPSNKTVPDTMCRTAADGGITGCSSGRPKRSVGSVAWVRRG
jgi:hypothetical protein